MAIAECQETPAIDDPFTFRPWNLLCFFGLLDTLYSGNFDLMARTTHARLHDGHTGPHVFILFALSYLFSLSNTRDIFYLPSSPVHVCTRILMDTLPNCIAIAFDSC